MQLMTNTERLEDCVLDLRRPVLIDLSRDVVIDLRTPAVPETPVGAQLRARAVGTVASAVLIAATVPLFLALVLATRLSTHGPAVSTEPAMDRRGRPFLCLSFATTGPRGGTRLGSMLRATRLDRLPRLWNVLVGDLSLRDAFAR